MTEDRPKECINSKCTNIFYVKKYLLHQPLICKECIDIKLTIKNK